MRILIADDSTLMREGIALILGDAGHEVVASVADADALVPAAAEHRPDLVVTDVRMPPHGRDDGLRAAVQIRQVAPQQPILVLSQYVVRAYADQLLASGAGSVGYLLKDRVADIDDFLAAVDSVASGGTVIDPQVVAEFMSATKDPLDALTPREKEVLELMAQGLSNPAIAQRMVVTGGAIEKHTQRIFAKLGLSPDDAQGNRRVMAVLTFLKGSGG